MTRPTLYNKRDPAPLFDAEADRAAQRRVWDLCASDKSEAKIMGPPPSNGIPTSDAAAARKTNAAIDRETIYRYIKALGYIGATSDQIEAATGMRHQNVSARLWQLAGKDRKHPVPARIVDSGKRRKTRSGRAATVWISL